MRKLLVLFALSILTLKAYCSDWIFFNFYKDYTLYYKTPAITIVDIPKVWIKQTFTNDAIVGERKRLIYKDKSNPNYKYSKYSYSLFLYEFNCNLKTMNYLERIDYDTNGNSINHDYYFPEDENIVPDTPMEALANELCRH